MTLPNNEYRHRWAVSIQLKFLAMTNAPPFHPLADLFPTMSNDEFEHLKADIGLNGQLNPIITHQGLIIDGRHRWSACHALGIKPKAIEWDGKGDLLEAVVSLNVRRRHLSLTQRVEIALSLVETKHGTNRWTSKGKMTISKASSLLGISEDTIQRARKIESDGIPALKAVVKKLGFSYQEGARIASLPIPDQQRIVNQGTWLRAVKLHEVRTLQQGERESFISQPFPPEEHDVLLVDPPWFYAKDNGMFRPNPAFHYPTMTDDELMALPVNELAKPNAMIFMWATGLTLERALKIMAHWQFEYISSGVWVKTRNEKSKELSHVPGLGPMLMTHEYILIGRKGKGLGKTQYQPRSVFFAQGGAGKNVPHSRKPEVIYEWVEKMWPSTRKIELFARSQRDGWKAWGFEAPKE